MKNIFICILILFSFFTGIAQDISGNVTYTFTTNFDGFKLPREAKLSFQKNRSIFSYGKGNGIRIFDRNGQEISMEDAQKVDPTNKGQLFTAFMLDPFGNEFFTDFQAKKIIFREIVVNKAFLVQEPVWIDFKWKLLNGIKKIGKFTCHKAETSFRGRTYTAWYTKDIPVPYGPWKFNGLPGLILEVEDAKSEVSFAYKSIKIPSAKPEKITPPINGEKISIQAFMEAEYNIRKAIVDAQRASAERKAGQKQEFDIGKINRVEITLK
ncbi:MAG: GLPGLI family protein [Bacteroidia bacterium]|nr:GLPGLI family protein [Bacteroidia bacterium]